MWFRKNESEQTRGWVGKENYETGVLLKQLGSENQKNLLLYQMSKATTELVSPKITKEFLKVGLGLLINAVPWKTGFKNTLAGKENHIKVENHIKYVYKKNII